jgi:transcriptional regulator with XRE-family HTH domain
MRRRKVLSLAFGRVIREARQQAELSQERLAFRSGVHPTYVSQLERGLKSPSLDVVAALARALHTKAHVLIRAAEDDSD